MKGGQGARPTDNLQGGLLGAGNRRGVYLRRVSEIMEQAGWRHGQAILACSPFRLRFQTLSRPFRNPSPPGHGAGLRLCRSPHLGPTILLKLLLSCLGSLRMSCWHCRPSDFSSSRITRNPLRNSMPKQSRTQSVKTDPTTCRTLSFLSTDTPQLKDFRRRLSLVSTRVTQCDLALL